VQELARHALVLGDEAAREVERAAGDVRVDIHAAGHHDGAAGIDGASARGEIGLGDEAAVSNAKVRDDAVDPVGGIVDRPTGDAKHGR